MNQRQGFVLLSMMLVLLIVSISVISSVLLLGINEEQQGRAINAGEAALNLVEGCAEDALYACKLDPASCNTSYTMSRPEGRCTIQASGSNPYTIVITNGPFDLASSADLYIGTHQGVRYFYNGAIDDVRVYNYARTAKQVLCDMNNACVNTAPSGYCLSGDTAFCVPPVSHWKFDDNTSLTTVTDSVGSNTGTMCDFSQYGGGASCPGLPRWTSGKYGTAANFTGQSYYATNPPSNVGNYVYFPNSGSLNFGPNQDFTIEFWVKSTQAPVCDSYPALLNKETTIGYEVGLHDSSSSCGDNDRWVTALRAGGSGTSPVITTHGLTDVANGSWHHLVIERKSSSLLTYEDGALVTQSVTSNSEYVRTINLNVRRNSTGLILNSWKEI